MNARLLVLLPLSTLPLLAQSSSVDLPQITVLSPRVALQEPAGTFATPVSALSFEPLVDVQARNFAEGQADIAIRGGIFENTGFRIGAVSLFDPQTGHYFAELPIAPQMLSAPTILTGAENAARGWDANAGTVSYQWRAIKTTGFASASIGEYASRRGELYQGYVAPNELAGGRLAFDVATAYSRSDGSRPWGEHEFVRTSARLQFQRENAQTDLSYGFQSKEFGWPNLYTPFPNVYETEDIQTNLVVLNHRVELGQGDYLSAGAYYRQNHDHYVFNRGEPGANNPAFGPPGPSFHKSWVYGAGFEGVITSNELKWNFAATWIDDELKSSSLIFGHYNTQNQIKFSLLPERIWSLSGGQQLDVKAGATYDDSNRESSTFSPVAEIALDHLNQPLGLRRVYVSYARSTQTPTYTALNSNAAKGLFRGNPDLDREIARNVELGATFVNDAWTTTAAIFYRKDSNLVDWTYSVSATNARSANPVDIDNAGFELVSRYTHASWDVVFGYTALHKSADYGAALIDASFYALNYPEHRLTLAVTQRFGHGIEVRMDNEFRIQKPNMLRHSTRHPLISSVGVFYTVSAVRGLRLSCEVQNLWNSDYEEVPAVPAAKRQVDFGAIYSW
ncbi:MAG TPA: TonB-dependent receptor [Opitutaceae bacterium]|nr:TonB-dependent receptor [Opitutaceae bacterium]